MKNAQQNSKLNELKNRMNWNDDDLRMFIYEMRNILTQLPREGDLKREKEIITTRFLKDISCPAGILGYEYLQYAILYLLEQPKYRMAQIRISYELYPEIAKAYNTTSIRVERNIRVVINIIFNNYNPLIDEVFGYSVGKPTNKEFIWRVVEYLQAHENL